MHRRATSVLLVVLLAALALPASVLADPPVATDDTKTVAEDAAPTTIDVLGNDNDPELDSLTIQSATDPDHGTVVIAGDDQTLTYEPDPDYHGPDTFDYVVEANGDVDTGTVDVTVTSVNDPPVATPDTFTIDEDITTLFAVRANDDDVDGDTLTITGSPDGAHGTTTISSGQISYNPASNYHGSDTFTYTISDGHGGTDTASVSVTIDAVNDDPVANTDSSTVTEDTPKVIDVLNDDTDVDGDTLQVSAVGGIHAKGTPSVTNGGDDVTYSPNLNATGSDSFTYTASDGHGGEDTTTVTITISAVNDPPDANDDTATVIEDTPKTIDVLGNDSDPDTALSIDSVTNGTKGSVTNNGDDVTYVPALNATGSDSFTYTLNGSGSNLTATVDVTITAVNDAPVAGADSFTIDEDITTDFNVLADDTDVDDTPTISDPGNPAHGSVSVQSGKIRYDPDPDYHGSDSFTYTITDGDLTDTALVTVTIDAVNDDPVADDDDFGVAEDAAATPVLVLAGDTDPDGDALTITGKTNGTKGTVVITGGGSGLTYRPGANLSGADSFTYTISDGNGGFDTATVTVDIGGANDPPNAVNDASMTVPQGAGGTPLAVLGNDSDPDGDTLTITSKTNGAHGTVTITGNGTGLSYNPAGIYKGTDTFHYTVADGHGGTDTATVLVTVVEDTVKPVMVAPVASFIGQTAGSTTTKIRLTWSATDVGGTGVGSYRLQVSVSGGAYTTITSATTAKHWDRSLTSGKTYRFRVRATDKEGNVGAYAYSLPIKLTRYSEASSTIAYVGTWTNKSTTAALGGHTRYASSPSRRAVFTFTGYDVGWIVTRYTTSGKADIYVDGVLARTVDLDRSSTAYRQLVFQAHFATLAMHTLEVRPVGDGRVDIDGFVVDR